MPKPTDTRASPQAGEADEGRIIQAIWDDNCGAHAVLVGLTGLNLNVLVELGMAHALGRTALAARQAGLKEPLPPQHREAACARLRRSAGALAHHRESAGSAPSSAIRSATPEGFSTVNVIAAFCIR
jgi:hypothetical protein